MIRPTEPSATRSVSKIVYPHGAFDPRDAHHGGVSRGRWWWRKNGLPLLTSLSMHAGVLLIGLLCFTAYKVVSRPTEEQQSVIPESPVEPFIRSISDDPKLDITIPHPNPGVNGDPKFPSRPGNITVVSGPKDSDPVVPISVAPRISSKPTGDPGPDDIGLPRFPGAGGIFDPGGTFQKVDADALGAD